MAPDVLLLALKVEHPAGENRHPNGALGQPRWFFSPHIVGASCDPAATELTAADFERIPQENLRVP
jgi:hypothetical protein